MFHILDNDDPFTIACLILILAIVGSNMVAQEPTARRWGWRVSAGAYVLFVVYAACVSGLSSAEDWLHIAFRGLLAAGVGLGLGWIFLSVATFLGSRLMLARTKLNPPNVAPSARDVRDDASREEIESHRIQLDAERRARELQDAAAQADAKRRRTDARATAALAYSRYAAKIHKRFPQKMFDRFVATFMGDDQPPDDVHRRGQELLQTLQQNLDEVEPPEQKQTPEDLAQWLQGQKILIESLPIEDTFKRLQLAELNVRYSELSSKLMERLQP